VIVEASVGKPWALLASLPCKDTHSAYAVVTLDPSTRTRVLFPQDANIIIWLRDRWYTYGPLLGLLP